jgi:hypothetical protein
MRAATLVLVCLPLLLSACAAVKPLAPPPATAAATTPAYLAPRYPSPAEKLSIQSIDDSYFGISSTRSGSAAVGFMLGPLGVLANRANVEAESRGRAEPLRALVAIDVAAMLRDAEPGLAAPADGTAARRVEVVPAVAVTFLDDDRYRLICIVNAALFDGGATPAWSGRYRAHVAPEFRLSDSGSIARATGELRRCLPLAYDLYRGHVAGQLEAKRP